MLNRYNSRAKGAVMARVPYLQRMDLPKEAQAKAEHIEATWGRIPRPLQLILHSPGISASVSDLMKVLQSATSLDPITRELAVLTVSRLLDCAFEWAFHERSAPKTGVRPEAIAAIKARRWEALNADEQRVAEYVWQMVANRVTDESFRGLEAALGIQGAVELTVTVGYYVMLCTTTNALAIDLPDALPSTLGS